MHNDLFCDIACKQQNCKDERICGDTFMYHHTNSASRSIAVLSDGMGHGVKANILSTLTASMIINFDYQNDDIKNVAHMIINTLPVCSVRKISYSTFSIIDINHSTGLATIIEYDNPQSLIYRGGEPLKCDWECIVIEGNDKRREQTILTTTFSFKNSDRIVFMSDGVTQSGLGTEDHPFGWKRKNVDVFIRNILNRIPNITSVELASEVLAKAVDFDNGYTMDDVSCGVVTIREVKRMLLSSCPPMSDSHNEKFISIIDNYVGAKVICGYHLAKLVSEIKGISIVKDSYSEDTDIQPAWHMKGVDLISESLATLNKIYEMLQNYDFYKGAVGPAAVICNMLMMNDQIDMLIGTRRGNGGMYMVDEYELRRKVMKHIARILEKRYNKEVYIQYI